MSKIQIEIPDDRWFRGEWRVRPQDKQLCVIIPKEYITEIGMYDEKYDRFLRANTTSTVRELFGNTKHYSAWVNMRDIDRWKPIGLPKDVNECILSEIEKWFEKEFWTVN